MVFFIYKWGDVMKQRKKDNIKTFYIKHRRGIWITIGIIGGVVLCFFGIKFYLRKPSLKQFFQESSLKTIKDKRDEIHKEYMSYTRNDNYRAGLCDLIGVLDREIRNRENNGQIPSAPGYHREHGRNLYKPD